MSSISTIGAALLLLLPQVAAAQATTEGQAPAEEAAVVFDPITVALPPAANGTDSTLGAHGPDDRDLAARKTTTGDAAGLLQGVPGVTLNGAGGISSLPAIHGLADDRLRIQLNGADLTTACPNHMNSPLSYADPARVGTVTVFSGVTPVSVGGDSIGGSIQVESAAPEFATGDDRFIARGLAGGFYRSNGGAYGYSLSATAAVPWLSLSYSQSDSWSENLLAGGPFKPAEPGTEGGAPIPGDEFGSSAYRGAMRRSLGLALRREGHLVRLDASQQTVGFEGFPNQRMDMTSNDNRTFTLRYTGVMAWGDLEASLLYQDTHHGMDMGPDRYSYGTGMPMEAEATTRGAAVRANVLLAGRDVLRTGAEVQDYTLYDWWPPVGGVMGPNAFWNVDFGQRQKVDAYAEWEARWTGTWTSQLGVRSDTVTTDAGPVQGYDNGLEVWADDAAAFNAASRRRTDWNWDLTTSLRAAPTDGQAYEVGYARKSRSPNLYQRFAWSTNAMAALMNNLVGDGNGYVGNLELMPEVAHTASLTGDWHDAGGDRWEAKATVHASQVDGYIDARRCDFGQCSAANVTATTGFVILQYVNDTARLHGIDLSGRLRLAGPGSFGSLTAAAVASWLRGENLTAGDGLFHIMPPSANVALVHQLGTWTITVEVVGVADKERVSGVRNEVRSGGYVLVNLRSSFTWKHARLDLAVANLLDRLHSNPVGGAYVGQGSSMTTSGIPWGVAVPGPGRSIDVALNVSL